MSRSKYNQLCWEMNQRLHPLKYCECDLGSKHIKQNADLPEAGFDRAEDRMMKILLVRLDNITDNNQKIFKIHNLTLSHSDNLFIADS